MTVQFRLAPAIAVARRPNELTLLALDGRADPQPVVVRDTGVVICEGLRTWSSLADLVDTVKSQYTDASTAEVEAGVRGFIDGLGGLGVVTSWTQTEPACG